ncbi:zf-TFIIB domain-containing protein [bacterium]|nr:zf-TFIIB domain-containing protein [bacterium]
MTRIRTEDEWFAKHERTLIEDIKRERQRREQRVGEALKHEEGRRRKELHWMNCPKCGSNMAEEPLQEKVMIDRCTRCGGIFFDRGELEDILLKPPERRKTFRIAMVHLVLSSWKSKDFDRQKILKDFVADRDRRKQEVAEWHSTEEGRKQKELHWMKCPKCGSDLKETDVMHGLLVDDCTLCRGIFLDYGELEVISTFTEKERKDIRDCILSLSLRSEESATSMLPGATK